AVLRQRARTAIAHGAPARDSIPYQRTGIIAGAVGAEVRHQSFTRATPWSGQPLSAHTIRIERVSEKNADAEKYRQCHYSIGHRLAPWRTMPWSAVVADLR